MYLKKFTVFILCALFAFSAAACTGLTDGGGTDPLPDGPVADTQAPVITLGQMADTLTAGESLEVRFTVSDDTSAASDIYTEVIILNADGINVTALTYTAASKTFTPTQAGVYSIIIEAYDEASNFSSRMHTVTVTEAPKPPVPPSDTQKPTVSLGSMASSIELGEFVTVRFTVSDDTSAADKIHTEVRIYDASGANVTPYVFSAENQRFTPTQTGNYTIEIYARDEAGNEQTATHAVAVVSPAAKMPTDPAFPADEAWGQDMSVHDPSVFRDPVSGQYYAYGSHFSEASSSDLVKWSYVANSDTEILGGAKQSVLKKAYAYTGGNENVWAPDVEYYNGKYYMYYSVTGAFGQNRSFIGRVESTSPRGPFNQNETEIVTSGGGNGPNAIDPELFYDKSGKLWMVYGSFFAGIYIKELYNSGTDWGLPKESGMGKLLWKGTGNGPEGPFVFYNEETEYYYLMASYGELSHNYNMNVARSKNPDGPYTDIAGNRVDTVENAGNKLAGNYKFNGANQYAALGHNSVVKTADGKYINVFHTRYRLGNAANPGSHNLRSHQLFFNEDGWPIMSPARYAGETAGRVTAVNASGAYDVIVHSSSKNADDVVNSVSYTLAADGTIRSGALTVGSWQLNGDYYITLTMDGVVYKGVIVPAWCVYKNKAVFSITATSLRGVSLWANGA